MKKSSVKEDRRTKILRCAVDIIDQEGLVSLTARTVAKKLKIPSSAVFYYFPTHIELFAGTQAFTMAEAEQVVLQTLAKSKRDKTGLAFLQSYIAGTLLWAYRHPSHVKVLTAGFIHSTGPTELDEQYRTTTAQGVEKIYHWLVMAVAEKELKELSQIRQVAEVIHSLLTGLCIKLVVQRPKNEAELNNITDMAWSMIETFIRSAK
jgi:AcrR family transcriptional regulator